MTEMLIARITAAAVCLCTALSAAPAADLAIRREADRIVVTSGDEPVAAFVFADPAVGRPAIRDLAAPGGTVVTRPCPPRKGVDADDHATMHPGVWLGFSSLSGADPWRHKSAVRFVGFEGEPAVIDGAVRFTAKIDYLAAAADTPDAPVACREQSSVSIRDRVIDGFPVRLLLWEAELAPGGNKPLVFGDTEEMGFGLRVATPLSPARGGRYLASHGGLNERGIFGRAAEWVDASGTIDGRRVGASVIDLAGNPREPFFHARDYGLVLANAFGRKAYGVKDSPPAITLEPGKLLRLRYAILLHGDVPAERLAGLVAKARDEIENAPGKKQAAIPTQHDVVVIGASPAGIAAAVAARREGRSVVLVEELSRVGGMYTAGGMGLADCFFMDRRMIDGLFEEIHGRIDAHYRRQGIAYRPANHRDRFPKDQGRWYHEPKVAEKIFQELLAEAGVDVITGQPVVAVRKPGSRIEAVELADGRLLAGRAFVDATYTGDLMALAKIRTDPSVPERIRDSFARFGLPKDEHVDTGHFPPMIYIREARRMVGEHVLTQHDIDREPQKPDSIGLGLASITVHNVQRVALADGYFHEGSAHTPYEPHGAPYQIPYRALLPTRAECDNLLVPVCLSASHVALGSIRVEPTWIMLGQSAGVAAALAAAHRIACHDVPYAQLRERLLAGRQVLDIQTEPTPKQPAESKP